MASLPFVRRWAGDQDEGLALETSTLENRSRWQCALSTHSMKSNYRPTDGVPHPYSFVVSKFFMLLL